MRTEFRGQRERVLLGNSLTGSYRLMVAGEEVATVGATVRLISTDDDSAEVELSISERGLAAAFDGQRRSPWWLDYARGFGWVSWGLALLTIGGVALLEALRP